MNEFQTLYSPVLRLKAGEIMGISLVRNSLKDYICPHFIIQPSKERNDKTLDLFDGLDAHSNLGVMLGKFWRGRPMLLNPCYVYKEYGDDKVASWLPSLFNSSRNAGVEAIPVARISDLEGNRFEGIRKSLNLSGKIKLSIVVDIDDLVSGHLKVSLESQLSRLDLAANDCCILLDFVGSHFGNPEVSTQVIESAYDDLQSIGRWHSIVFQGTSYPETNPADHKSTVILPRNEWLSWKAAMTLSENTPENFVYGDYGADSAKMHFGKGGTAAIRHLRYTTPDNYLIVRGAETGKDKSRMQWVAEQIINSVHFAGREFSLADDFIYRMARESAGPGVAKDWRQINTTHHLTRVVVDIARLRGIQIKDHSITVQSSEQMMLLGI